MLEVARRPKSSSPPRLALQFRARATLFWGLAVLILVQGGMRLGIDFCWPELRDPSFEIKARRLTQTIAESPAPPVTVIMVGSSITRNAFKAQYLEEMLGTELGRPAVVVNMSTLGAGPLTELVWVRRLLERGIRPDLVCIEFTPLLFNAAGLPMDAPRFPEHILTSSDLDVVQRYSADPELRDHWWKYRWFPAYAHRLTIVNYVAEPLVPNQDRVPTWGGSMDDRFWAALEPRSPAELSATLVNVRSMLQAALKDFAAGQLTLQALEELLALLQKEGIHAAVVMAPEGPTARRLYPKETLDQLVQTVLQLSRRYDCAFIDAFDWLEEDMFADSLHPTLAGADVFSTRLARELLLPALRR